MEMETEQNNAGDEDEQPKKLKIPPKVYIIGFFALMYVLRNLYVHFTVERPDVAAPSNQTFFSEK